MKVALIQPPMASDYPPLSLGCLAAYLALSGHTPRVFDLQIASRGSSWQQELGDFDPRVVGITAMTPTIGAASRVAATCREILPEATLVLGGHHVSFLPEEAMRRYPVYDVGVIGEGEVTLRELVEAIDGGSDLDGVPGLIVRHGPDLVLTGPRARIRDLDSLPWPHDHYDLDHYLWYGGYTGRWTFKCASAFVSRGCPFRCRFCAAGRFWSRRYAVCSPDHAVEEMRYLAHRGARAVFFRDSTFNVRKSWVQDFCEAKRRAGIDLRWICNSRVDTLDEEQIVLMREAGLEALYFGVESGSQRILDYYDKGTTAEQAREAFALCHKHGVATAANFMIGAPIETRADIEQSRRLARELNAKYTPWFIYTPLPGADLYDEFLKLGFQPDFDRLIFNRASVPVGDLTCEELEAAHRSLVAEFRRQPSRADVWRRRLEMLSSVHSLSDVGHLGKKLVEHFGHSGTS